MLRITKFSILKNFIAQLIILNFLNDELIFRTNNYLTLNLISAQQQNLIQYPTQNNGTKKKFKKRRRFNATLSTIEIKNTW